MPLIIADQMVFDHATLVILFGLIALGALLNLLAEYFFPRR